MTLDLSAFGTRALVLDVEGTTTPITFVSKVLFPYARTHAAGFLEDHAGEPEVRDAVDLLRTEHAAEREAPPEDLLQYVFWLMDRDRKSTGLKIILGIERGYLGGSR
jgi:enolase-phosphatase E1